MKKLKVLPIAALFLGSAVLWGSTAAQAESQVRLVDISGHWAQKEIATAVSAGYVDGYDDGTFLPDHSVSRAEFVKMMVSALKVTHADGAEDEWYQPYINAAVATGVHRYEDFDQDINGPITRQEMMRLVVRATDKQLQNPDVHMDDKSFVYNATKTGLIQGQDGGKLALDKSTTRAEAVTVVDRVLQTNAGKQQPVDKNAVANAELALKKTNMFTVAPDLFGGKTEGRTSGDDLSPWNVSNFLVETPDGNYKGMVDEVIFIDFEDDNDPNLNLLGDFDTLRWSGAGDRLTYPVNEYRQSYGIVVKTSLIHSTDKNVYGNHPPRIAIRGVKTQDELAFRNGDLNRYASFIDETGFIENAYLIPKHNLQTYGYIEIAVKAPAIPPNNTYERPLIRVELPKLVP